MKDENPYAVNFDESIQDAPQGYGHSGELARRMLRLAAVLADGIIALLIMGPIMYATGYFDRILQAQRNGLAIGLGETIGMAIVGMVIFLVLHGYLLATRGQTIGKLMAGIRIVDYESGELVPFGRLYGLRYLALGVIQNVPVVGPIVGVVDALMIFGSERRCLHDIIAGTKVVVVQK